MAINNTPNSNLMTGSRPTFLSKAPMNFLIMDSPRTSNIHQYIRECKKHNVTDVVRVCEPSYSEAPLKKAGIALHEMPYPDGHSPPDEVLDRWLKLVDERFIHPTNVPVPTYASGPGLPGGGGAATTPGGSVGSTVAGSGVGSGSDVAGLGTASAGGAGTAHGTAGGTRSGSPIGTSATPSPSVNGSTVHTIDSHNHSHHNNGNPSLGTSNTSLPTTGPTIAVHCVAGLGRAPVLVAIALIEFAKMEPVDAATFIRKHRRGAINNTQLDWLERYKRRYRAVGGGGCCIVM